MREGIMAQVEHVTFHQFPCLIFIVMTMMMLLQKTTIQGMRLVYTTLLVVSLYH